MRRGAALALLMVGAVACSGQQGAETAEGTWVGTITTEGNVTTVVNESGSVWGGTATLVEETSIGVEAGAEEYMFGELSAVHVDGERIYVVDRQAPIVRVYDYDGNYLDSLGGPGEGPGEYSSPASIATAPDGRIFLLDPQVLLVYSAEGEPLGRWQVGFSNWGIYPIGVDDDGVPWLPTAEIDSSGHLGRSVVQAVGPDGRVGEPIWVSDSAITPTEMQLPFTTGPIWTVTPAGEVVSGDSSEYRFRLHRHDGTTLAVVENSWQPAPVVAAEAHYWRELRRTLAGASGADPPDLELPDFKPVFHNFLGSQTGEIWVLRHAEGVESTDCPDPTSGIPPMSMSDSCWPITLSVEAFGADGRFLGDVALPDDVIWRGDTRASIRGRTVVTTSEDDAGTLMVKRYRLVLPGEQGQ